MPQYTLTAALTPGNSAIETELCALTVASDELIKIVRIKLSLTSTPADTNIRVKILRTSAKGATATFGAGTIVKKDPGMPSSFTTAEVVTIAGTTGPTIVDTIDDLAFSGRSSIQWEAIDDSDAIIITNGIFELTAISSGISSAYRWTVEWKEH